ncbi:MoaD/ThiS family protein [Desulfosporosinus sp. BICA1-9]|uniref:sulfur carrier protein ThiS n=1 Tax=Desulfosporosinus sp. BICA1-9 TaxID=1531958 RepID=UPI00054BB16C|nr:MoaD/ThiS family protein [Desulfosporosinus sp. BICA1-9]KJS48200.1 MAG: hypothetical protein VR66_15260 [Peptococcaceae bacterium BRH_c23]KJS80993.1 MAG: hypothetical protein JL57_27355 [Desulfosporosinus sp. BICA1-9]HBW38631.1 molybdopterin synthase sulfur carrier subunit [Desulfosporosinus sp.]
MQITIRLYGPLGKYSSQLGLYQREIKPDLTLARLVEQLGVPYSSVGFIVVNSVKRDLDYRLEENDDVKFFPFIAGG